MALTGPVGMEVFVFGRTEGDLGVLGGTVIHKGAAVGIEATSGMLRGLVAGDKFRGFARKGVDATGKADGELRVNVLESGKIELSVSGVVNASLGAAVYASDDGTFTLTSAGNSFVGKVARVLSAGLAYVTFDAHLGQA